VASLNVQQIIGKLGKDPELKTAANGTKYLFLGVATDDYIGKGSDGKSKTETTWHDVTVFGTQAEYVAKYGKKGSQVFVSGRTQKTKKENSAVANEYNVRVIAQTVIVFGSSSGTSVSTDSSSPTAQEVSQGARIAGPAVETVTNGPEDLDELPF